MADLWPKKIWTNLHQEDHHSRSLISTIKKLRAKVIPNENSNWTPLHCAAHRGSEKVIRILLENGVPVDRISDDGSTPLHLACQRNNIKCVKAILQYKPQLNIRNTELDTPLNIFVKCCSHSDKLLRKFLDEGADPNIANADGFTPLHSIATVNKGGYKRRAETFTRILIDYGAEVNFKNRFGDTPLHIAVRNGFESLVTIFLETDADISIINCDGHTPMDIALSSNNTNIQHTLDHLGIHIILRQCYQLPVDQKHWKKICQIERFDYFKEQCESELLELKANKIGDSCVTYYDMLISPPRLIAKYLRNSDIFCSMMNFNTWKYKNFGGRLIHNFHEGMRRYDAIKIGYNFCWKVFPVHLPHNCLEIIMDNLSSEDLQNLDHVIFCKTTLSESQTLIGMAQNMPLEDISSNSLRSPGNYV